MIKGQRAGETDMMSTETSQTERDAEKILRAYGSRHHRGDLMMITELIDSVDLTHERLTNAIRHLGRTEDMFIALPWSQQGDLTAADRDNAVIIGNQAKHAICWY